MERSTTSYTLATHIFDSFFAHNANLTESEIAQSGVMANPDSWSSHIPQLYAQGESHGRRAYQTMSLARNGRLYLSTTYRHEVGIDTRTSITPTSAPDRVQVLVDSLFMHALVGIANGRPE